MTISTSNAQAGERTRTDRAATGPLQPAPPSTPPATPASGPVAAAELPRTVWSRFIILMLCIAVVTTTLAFGTVHSWSLAVFQLSAGVVFALWMLDAWRTRTLRVSRNFLQLPLVGLFAVGVVQLFPIGGSAAQDLGGALLSVEPVRSFSFDPYATRFVLVEIAGLFIYFAAALAFIDSPRRLRLVARLVIIFGFTLAVYGLMQHFVNPRTIFFVREPPQAEPFGPYINRHHFAGYMELVLAMPLGLLFAGAVERERVALYAFASAIMAIALVMTNSRGGMLSMVCEILFLAAVAATVKRRGGRDEKEGAAQRVRAAVVRIGLGFAMIVAVFFGVLYFGGEDALSRLVGSVNSADPTTGRAHFWKGTVGIIEDHPFFGTGLGAFGAVYPRYDTANGTYRLEQAHNDYLQILSDAGIVGGVLGLAFVVALFRTALRRMQSHDRARRGIALGALAGCTGALVHSFFDFTLHTTANALLFLVLAALATINGRVEEPDKPRHRRRRRHRQKGADTYETDAPAGAGERERAA
ncbi:MAG TPA: O-antigen ligase family protein [Pyrinomonadaceae bacterium]|nr:O-antigen ligase family protein [Pyrinomonadaceae bacterium]